MVVVSISSAGSDNFRIMTVMNTFLIYSHSIVCCVASFAKENDFVIIGFVLSTFNGKNPLTGSLSTIAANWAKCM